MTTALACAYVGAVTAPLPVPNNAFSFCPCSSDPYSSREVSTSGPGPVCSAPRLARELVPIGSDERILRPS
ncbi:unnamed protein product [Boreogadus saida]